MTWPRRGSNRREKTDDRHARTPGGRFELAYPVTDLWTLKEESRNVC